MAQIVTTLYRDRKSRETKSASDHERIVSYQNVSRRIRSCQIGNQNRDNPALHRDHHIRTYVILSERATLSLLIGSQDIDTSYPSGTNRTRTYGLSTPRILT